jgi:uroporphyrinogen III methyltransferase / synthase
MGGRRARGTVYLVGAGPGDPDLITVRGRDLLSRADVVIYDALSPPDLLGLTRQGAERVRAPKVAGGRRTAQRTINRLMIDRARRGRVVVRLKGGDPCLFGRGGEEAEALAEARVKFEIVPGVTAAVGAAASAGIPLTHREHASSVTLATGHVDPSKSSESLDWRALARSGTLVLYMGVARLERIVARLREAGMDGSTPAALVRWATRPEQVVIAGPLAEIAARARRARIAPPALLILGRVVLLKRRLDWFGRRPLIGRTIVVTRASDQAGPLCRALEEHGARVLRAPAIVLAPPRSWAPLDGALARLGEYRFLIFTSVNGVARFFERLAEKDVDVRDLKGIEIIAIGPATAAAVTARGLRVAAVPEEFRAEGIVELLEGRGVSGAGVLIPRAEVARDYLVEVLRGMGARVNVVPVYRTVPSGEGAGEVAAALRAGEVDLVSFTSPSTVTHFVGKLRGRADARRLRSVPAAVIGPITAEAARRSGFRVAVMPRRYTVPALAEEIVRRLRSFPSGTPRES